MPGLPELPVNVSDPTLNTQVDGKRDSDPVYQTHRGPKKPSGDRPPPYAETPDVALRYSEPTAEEVTPT